MCVENTFRTHTAELLCTHARAHARTRAPDRTDATGWSRAGSGTICGHPVHSGWARRKHVKRHQNRQQFLTDLQTLRRCCADPTVKEIPGLRGSYERLWTWSIFAGGQDNLTKVELLQALKVGALLKTTKAGPEMEVFALVEVAKAK